ncbi:MAG TPA: response regulator transcription factor [Gemmatimonadaceae bacterium]|nr:response regulator transcription factor [Gemmatimonadaceae bacterium]
MSAPIRVAVADDHPVVRDGLVAMLETQPDFAVVGQAGTGADALALVDAERPDVLLLDLEMPGLDGVGVLRRLGERGERTRAIVFTVFDTDERIIAAVEAGAAGYLLKGAPRAEVFAAVRAVAAGGSLLAPAAASAVLRRVRGGANPAPGTAPGTAPALTPRERAVLEHLARGLGNKQIAAALGISERTVKFHVSALFTKLGASNRTEAVRRAAQAGLVRL